MLDVDETIAALASAPGGAARAIVRVSGPQMIDCLESCFLPDDGDDLRTVRRPSAIQGKIALAGVFSRLPCTVYLWPSSRSYTRQPTAEIHTLGSPPLADALLAELCAAGARLARPGEFTLRAFLAGRLDLTQAEAVLGVIDARDRQHLETALAQLAGGLAAPLARLRGDLLDVLAQLEAGLDFVEEDIEFISTAEIEFSLAAAQATVDGLLAKLQDRAEASDTIRAVLIGAANVGKSSLFNALTGQQAIVSDRAGTTRDYLAARLDFAGIVCELVDTAGIIAGNVAGPEQAAQAASATQRSRADIEIVCIDSTRSLNAEERDLLAREPADKRVVVFTKADLPRQAPDLPGAIATSSRTGAGLDRLLNRLGEVVAGGQPAVGVVVGTAIRCHDSLRQASEGVGRARGLAQASAGGELVAAELRRVLHHLGEVAGEVYTDDILDRIFSRFCIGK